MAAVLALALVCGAVVLITKSTLRPGATTSSVQTSTAPPKVTVHHVRPGDSLATIAARYHSSVAILEQLNPAINPQALRPGQALRVSPAP